MIAIVYDACNIKKWKDNSLDKRKTDVYVNQNIFFDGNLD